MQSRRGRIAGFLEIRGFMRIDIRKNRLLKQAPRFVARGFSRDINAVLSSGVLESVGHPSFRPLCKARLQAGNFDSSTCSPKGERYRLAQAACWDHARFSHHAIRFQYKFLADRLRSEPLHVSPPRIDCTD